MVPYQATTLHNVRNEPQNGDPQRTLYHPEETTAHAVISVAPAGLGVKKQDKVTVRPGPADSERGVISGLSDRARHRLMQKLMRIDLRAVASPTKNPRQARAYFVTLTYPSEFPDCKTAKRDLKALRKRLERAYPVTWALWVQEFQQRGAPHFHLVVILEEAESVAAFRRWLARAWYEVVDSGDVKHFQAGTSAVAVYVEPEGLGTLMGYLSGYLGGHAKEEQQAAPEDADGDPVETGRMWGFWREDAIDYLTLAVVLIETPEAWDEFKRRVAAHYAKSPYLSRVHRFNWTGGLLFGEGLELLTELLDGVEGITLRRTL
jgi:hypothetical protein